VNDADRPTREVVEVDEPTRERDYRAVSIVGDFSRELAEEFGRLWTAESLVALRAWKYRPPSRWRRILDAIKDLLYVFADHITDDGDKAFERRLYLAILICAVAAFTLYGLAWVLR